jgi:polysaccharide deacetylase 2 family uncharacterized protein YibQ
LFLTAPLIAEAQAAVRIAIIIDDIGYNQSQGLAALKLPGDITYAILPHAPHSQGLLREARRQNREIILHLPMQALHQITLDRGGLRIGMGRQEFFRTLFKNLDELPHIVGVNNHMGSLLTSNTQAMQWLMQGLKAQGSLFFIDSLTSPKSVAGYEARRQGIPSGSRDVFLDHERSVDAINRQFDLLLSTARRKGQAIAIGHPYPETLSVLRQRLANLPQSAVSLVKVSDLIHSYSEDFTWPTTASLSPLPRVAKNSKPSPSSTCCVAPALRSSAPDSTSSR